MRSAQGFKMKSHQTHQRLFHKKCNKKCKIIDQIKKRAPTALTVECGVCSGPAPDHLHFGGNLYTNKNIFVVKILKTLLS